MLSSHSRTVDREVHRIGLDVAVPRKRFTTQPTIDGFEVIDLDGRPVDRRETRAQASGVAFRLNEAAKHSQRALIRALRAA